MRDPLWQVYVERTEDGESIPVCPAGPKEGAQMLCEAINKQIALGRELVWTNPRVERVLQLEN